MIRAENLEESIGKSTPSCKPTAFSRGQEYRQRADKLINLYLTRFVASNFEVVDHLSYRSAIDDYVAAAREFENDIHLKRTHHPCLCVFTESGQENDPRCLKTEALLAHGNAIKESFIPTQADAEIQFQACKERASHVYADAFKYAKEINYGPYGQFTLLEQLNLDARETSWREGKRPRRIVVFHTTRSPRSQHFLKGVYYYALRSGVEVWEYSEGRIPRTAIDLLFLKDRVLDSCGIVFLASPEYLPERDNIEFEIEAAEILRESKDPARRYLLNLDANENIIARLSCCETAHRDPEQFDGTFPEFLKSLTDIYECRKSRLENDDLWKKLSAAGLDPAEF